MKHPRRKKNVYRTIVFKACIIMFVVTIVCVVIALLILVQMDRLHDSMKGILEFFSLGEDIHFSGDTWFSIAASGIVSIPGILCGVIALAQADWLYYLENRYNKPMLGFHSAKMKAVWMDHPKYGLDKGNKDYKDIRFEDWMVTENCQNRIAFEMEIEIKNEIELSNIEIEQINFIFMDGEYIFKLKDILEKYKFHRRVERKYEEQQYKCLIYWELYPYEYISREKTEDEFWKRIDYFTNYERYLVDDYKELTTIIRAKVYYQYSASEYENIEGRLTWKADNGGGRYGSEAERVTYSGVFLYPD